MSGEPAHGGGREQGAAQAARGPVCAACAASVQPEDGYCEACGADLLVRRAPGPGEAAAPCPDCGGTSFTDGYCDQCGRLAPSPRDRWERDLHIVAGVSDRGLRHSRNEDAMAFAVIGEGTEFPASVVVVCDGVSSSVDPQRASQLAADTMVDLLVRALRRGEPAPVALSAAIEAAQQAVTALADEYPDRANAPSCTAAAAVVERGRITAGWVGDSRVYWLAADPAASCRLTDDDTWAGQLIAGGAVDEAEAYKAPHAHAILRWLGPDAPPEPPHVRHFAPGGPGLVLVCSDGLWNYVWDATDLAALARDGRDGLAATCAALTAVALDGGGQDNITTVLARHPPYTPAEPEPETEREVEAAQTLRLPPAPEGAAPRTTVHYDEGSAS
ncbi:protein phosphatase 2C domain-containing protein [Actinocrinis puniceicyclus]|uniref:protein phosphatase 2C domain-containing protein n=1 Tax=Actinocrinis puniceicyclus TaxID=977794 RepID=UPI0028AE3642|nr:protein phosphatase 2C domain-containing protein [Actinocrinis puniceicyclus]